MAGNLYGFDFLKSQHTINDAGGPSPQFQTSTISNNIIDDEPPYHIAQAVANKPDLEKQFDVIHFLQAHRSSGYLAPSVIKKATGVDLAEKDLAVAKMLETNPKISIENVPDPENPSIFISTYAYQAKYNNVRDHKTLLAQINRGPDSTNSVASDGKKSGIPMKDLIDSYDGVNVDLVKLITAGDILAVSNPEDKDKILFPRGESFLVELDGIVSPILPPPIVVQQPPQPSQQHLPLMNGTHAHHQQLNIPHPTKIDSNSNVNGTTTTPSSAMTMTTKPTIVDSPCFMIETDSNPMKQIRRGEAIQVGGQWFRVSSAVRDGIPLSEQPVRAQAPLSVSSNIEMSQRNEVDGYIRPFTIKKIPLDSSLTKTSKENLIKSKEARDKLHKLSAANKSTISRGGVAGSAVAKLLSSHATSDNPIELAKSFASTFGHASASASGSRKRPTLINKSSTNITSSSTLSSSGGGGTGTTAQQQAQRVKKNVDDAQKIASDPNIALYTHARRHGCTKDVRNMYLESRSHIPDNEEQLHKLMVEYGLVDADEPIRRPRLKTTNKSNVDNDGKPKKRRYYERKNQRMTNVHLIGTEIGAELARAQEKQKLGKSVGDGGM